MKLNHINLVVANVIEAIQFFETYFGFECTMVKGDNVIAILKGSDSFELVLMADSADSSNSFNYPENFHIGFTRNSKDEVDKIYAELRRNGLAPEREPAKIRNSYGFYFYFDKVMIEVTAT